MDIKKQVEDSLIKHKKQTITLWELESICSGSYCSYAELSQAILELEESGVLQMVKAQGRNGKEPSLAYQYRINKSMLNRSLQKELQLAELRLDPNIKLNAYYSLPIEVWLEDQLFIEQIDAYLREFPMPHEPVPAPERSFELVGDEKWITEGGGEELLNRIGLWEQMKVLSVADPLMFAINPRGVHTNSHVHHHLIVENKTTFQALLQELPVVPFTSLIYGSGKKVIRSIELLSYQLPLNPNNHRFHYFGDIDHEGINIWYALDRKVNGLYGEPVRLAIPFYEACVQKPYAQGKETQRKDEKAMEAFLSHFDALIQLTIQTTLSNGGYYPQEIIKSTELRQIWRSAVWTD